LDTVFRIRIEHIPIDLDKEENRGEEQDQGSEHEDRREDLGLRSDTKPHQVIKNNKDKNPKTDDDESGKSEEYEDRIREHDGNSIPRNMKPPRMENI
jgi:hypothetical protein